MKKSIGFFSLIVLCTSFFAFTKISGGDILQVFLNGQQVHQQFIHVDKAVKTIAIPSTNESDRIEVFYSHCGATGKSRMLTFRNENGDVLKEMNFPDEGNKTGFMPFYRKDISKKNSGTVKLYYSSKELPAGKWIATIVWTQSNPKAKTASL